MYKYFSTLIVVFCLLICGCKNSTKSDDDKSSVRIEWITPSGGEIQYERVYNDVGLIVGLNFEAEFRVIENSGNITVNISLTDDDGTLEESTSLNVFEGPTYLVIAYANIDGTTSCVASSVAATVTFSSPSASTDKDKTVLNWIGNSLPYTPYCVNLGVLSNISIAEKY